jgi:Flp pilus assembly pilin Flp
MNLKKTQNWKLGRNGAVMMEYVILGVLIAASVTVVMVVFGNAIKDRFYRMTGNLAKEEPTRPIDAGKLHDGDRVREADELMKEWSNRQLPSSQVAELVSILDVRAEIIAGRLTQHTNDPEVAKLKEIFDRLRAEHRAALEQGNLVVAHEILPELNSTLVRIDRLFMIRGYSNDSTWTRYWFIPSTAAGETNISAKLR